MMGHWFIPPLFFDYVDREMFQKVSKSRREKAFSRARDYISEQVFIKTEEEEYVHFCVFFRILFDQLPEFEMTEERCDLIAKDMVYNKAKYTFYEDVPDFLMSASQQYPLAIVSDAWPSLDGVYKQAGLRSFFKSFIISSQEGVTKPHERMYSRALEALGVEAHEALFIDDNLKNCHGAKKLGIATVLICRDFLPYLFYKLTCREHRVVSSLKAVKLK
jgi:putative hydrolase of the HAD superfamily